MNIGYHRDFERAYQKLHTTRQKNVRERIALFSDDEFHPLLNNHALRGKYEGYRSINVGGDLRAIYKELGKNIAYFVELGTHSKLYS